MDLAACDLQNYQLARQLHTMAHLYDVFLNNVMSYPLFYESLHPSAKREARTVLLALHRVFEKQKSGGTLFMRSPYRVHTMRCILSFLMYPQYLVTPPSSVSRHILSLASSSAPAAVPAEVQGTPVQTIAVPSSLDATPLRLDASAEKAEVPAEQPSGSAGEQRAAAPAPQPLSPPQPPASMPPITAAVPTPVSDVLLRPLFFLRPQNRTEGDRAAPHFGTTTHIYVRMVHTHLLNEESLNPYFGRYGQVDCKAIQRTSLQQYAVHLGEAATEALHQLFGTATKAEASSLFVQDFIISVDSHQNAVHAVRRAYYKELVCIALHDPAGEKNTHCLADVNAWMRRHAFVWRLRADVQAIAGEKETTADAAAAAVARRRKRHRARQRLRERRRKRRAVLGDGGSATPSSASSEGSVSDSERAGKGRDRASSSASTSSTLSSSPSSSGRSSHGSGSDAEDGTAPFVPDVLLDGFPYWTTEGQLKVLLQDFGTVVEMRLSLDDLSGAFTGSVLVRMSTVDEALHVSRSLHATLYRGHRLISGVINERLEVVALEDGAKVRIPVDPEQVPYDVTLNERVWV